MADLGDSVTLNGVTYRTEAAHETALQEAVALLKNGHALAGGSPTGTVQILAKLDRIEQALTVRRASTEAAPDALKTLTARLDMIRNALEQLARSTSEGTTPLPAALAERLDAAEGYVETRTRKILQRIEAFELSTPTDETIEVRLAPLAERLERIEAQQALLLELLDTATAPPPPPVRVPPQITRSAPAPEVSADPTPFPPSRDQVLLQRFLADPTLTCQGLAAEVGVQTREGVRGRLQRAAQQTGQTAQLQMRMRQSQVLSAAKARASQSAAAGNAPPPSTAAGSSR